MAKWNMLYILMMALMPMVGIGCVVENPDIESVNQASIPTPPCDNKVCKPMWTCINNSCVAPTYCTNNALNAPEGETDVDCGGWCLGCQYGKKCLVNSDCVVGLICNNVARCDSPCNHDGVCQYNQGELFGWCTDCRCNTNGVCDPQIGEVCGRCGHDCCTDMGPPRDMSGPDLRLPPDLTLPPDLSVVHDLTVPPDLKLNPDLYGVDMAKVPLCGDKVCDQGETPNNCCQDCGCGGVGGKKCINNVCLYYGCNRARDEINQGLITYAKVLPMIDAPGGQAALTALWNCCDQRAPLQPMCGANFLKVCGNLNNACTNSQP